MFNPSMQPEITSGIQQIISVVAPGEHPGSRQVIRVPAVIACETVGDRQIMVLEWIEQGLRTERFWRRFGEQLAHLHQVERDIFGLWEDNYMGALPQDNAQSANWTAFFIERRLAPQIRMAAGRGLLTASHIRQFERLYQVLPGIFPDASPSLLHGDLWSGNFLCDAYAYYAPLPANYREHWEICNLYPLLIHLNLFGKSYLGSIMDTIQRF